MTADKRFNMTVMRTTHRRARGEDQHMRPYPELIAAGLYGTNRQRLTELAARNPGYRLLPDNFYGVEQSVVVAKGNKAMIDFVNGVLDEAKLAGLIARSIEQAGLLGVDVAPPGKK
jgi:hypothetical protein